MMLLVMLVSVLAVTSEVSGSFGTTACSSTSSGILRTYELSSKCPTYLLTSPYTLKNFSATNRMECAIRCNNGGKTQMFYCGVDSPSFSFRCHGFNQLCLAVFPVLSCSNGVTQPDGSCKCRPGFYGLFCEKYFKSCMEIYLGNVGAERNGTYIFETDRGVPIEAKCEFRSDHILTFFTKASLAVMSTSDLSSHYNDASQFTLRCRYTDNSQNDSLLEELLHYSSTNLTFSLNESTRSPQNSNLGVYLYIEFAPAYLITQGSVNGYRANGMDHAFVNCDSNSNSFFIFYPNVDGLQPVRVGSRFAPFDRNWETGSRQVDAKENLADDFFMLFEIAFGGCGSMTLSTLWSDIVGLTVGFKYVIPT